jgi:hypothetical protein
VIRPPGLLYNRPMRLVLAALILLSWAGCNPEPRIVDAPAIDTPVDEPRADACVGLQCAVTACGKQGLPPTTVSGTIFAPNGSLPLYGVTVYVPLYDPGPLPEGARCVTCIEDLPGKPIVKTITTEQGRFTLEDAPVGPEIPLVITIGKWRRRLTIPVVNECADNPVDPFLTRLPKNRTEGDIPRIAIGTGGCDALECLFRKLGVDDTEFTADTQPGRIHLYAGSGGAAKLVDGTQLSTAPTMWNSLDKLKQYDIAMFSCECSENPSTKPLAAMNNMKAYADTGGRLFFSHYHHVWITGNGAAQSPPVWPEIASCTGAGFDDGSDLIDTVNNPKGLSFSLWMQFVMGSPFPGVIPIQAGTGRQTCLSIDNTKAERWVRFPKNGVEYPQNFQFSTPNEMPSNARCGKVVFSDMHVASGSTSSAGTAFPGGCSNQPMTPQELALSFMLFDIAGCVGIIQ